MIRFGKEILKNHYAQLEDQEELKMTCKDFAATPGSSQDPKLCPICRQGEVRVERDCICDGCRASIRAAVDGFRPVAGMARQRSDASHPAGGRQQHAAAAAATATATAAAANNNSPFSVLVLRDFEDTTALAEQLKTAVRQACPEQAVSDGNSGNWLDDSCNCDGSNDSNFNGGNKSNMKSRQYNNICESGNGNNIGSSNYACGSSSNSNNYGRRNDNNISIYGRSNNSTSSNWNYANSNCACTNTNNSSIYASSNHNNTSSNLNCGNYASSNYACSSSNNKNNNTGGNLNCGNYACSSSNSKNNNTGSSHCARGNENNLSNNSCNYGRSNNNMSSKCNCACSNNNMSSKCNCACSNNNNSKNNINNISSYACSSNNNTSSNTCGSVNYNSNNCAYCSSNNNNNNNNNNSNNNNKACCNTFGPSNRGSLGSRMPSDCATCCRMISLPPAKGCVTYDERTIAFPSACYPASRAAAKEPCRPLPNDPNARNKEGPKAFCACECCQKSCQHYGKLVELITQAVEMFTQKAQSESERKPKKSKRNKARRFKAGHAPNPDEAKSDDKPGQPREPKQRSNARTTQVVCGGSSNCCSTICLDALLSQLGAACRVRPTSRWGPASTCCREARKSTSAVGAGDAAAARTGCRCCRYCRRCPASAPAPAPAAAATPSKCLQSIGRYPTRMRQLPLAHMQNRNGDCSRLSLVRTAAGSTLHERRPKELLASSIASSKESPNSNSKSNSISNPNSTSISTNPGNTKCSTSGQTKQVWR